MTQLLIEVPEENVELLLALLPKFNARLVKRFPSTSGESANESIIKERPQYPIHDCEMMRFHLETWFATPENVDNADAIIAYYPASREYGLPIYDGGSSYILIEYCPWCGAKLSDAGSEFI